MGDVEGKGAFGNGGCGVGVLREWGMWGGGVALGMGDAGWGSFGNGGGSSISTPPPRGGYGVDVRRGPQLKQVDMRRGPVWK